MEKEDFLEDMMKLWDTYINSSYPDMRVIGLKLAPTRVHNNQQVYELTVATEINKDYLNTREIVQDVEDFFKEGFNAE